jgi:hypothetical protein
VLELIFHGLLTNAKEGVEAINDSDGLDSKCVILRVVAKVGSVPKKAAGEGKGAGEGGSVPKRCDGTSRRVKKRGELFIQVR